MGIISFFYDDIYFKEKMEKNPLLVNGFQAKVMESLAKNMVLITMQPLVMYHDFNMMK
jgi:hypothetical protein